MKETPEIPWLASRQAAQNLSSKIVPHPAFAAKSDRTPAAERLLSIAQDLVRRSSGGEPIGLDDLRWAQQLVSRNGGVA